MELVPPGFDDLDKVESSLSQNEKDIATAHFVNGTRVVSQAVRDKLGQTLQ